VVDGSSRHEVKKRKCVYFSFFIFKSFEQKTKKMVSTRQNDLCNGDCALAEMRKCGENMRHDDPNNCTVCNKYVNWKCTGAKYGSAAPRRHPKCVPPPPEHPLCNGECANKPNKCGHGVYTRDVYNCTVCHKYVNNRCAKILSGDKKSPRCHPKCVPPPDAPVVDADAIPAEDPPFALQLKKRTHHARNTMTQVLLTTVRYKLTQAADSGRSLLYIDNMTQAAIDVLRDEDRFTIRDVTAIDGKVDQFEARIEW